MLNGGSGPVRSVFDSKPSPRFGLSLRDIEKQETNGGVKMSTRSFAIYRHQVRISIVSSDGPLEMAAERFFICQGVKAPGDY
jgi:hypothetical protein